MWQRADNRFFWNRYLLTYFIKNKAEDWILPTMKGFIQNAECRVNGHNIQITLISRLSSLR